MNKVENTKAAIVSLIAFCKPASNEDAFNLFDKNEKMQHAYKNDDTEAMESIAADWMNNIPVRIVYGISQHNIMNKIVIDIVATMEKDENTTEAQDAKSAFDVILAFNVISNILTKSIRKLHFDELKSVITKLVTPTKGFVD